MSDDITGLCRDHSFETATAMCRRCSLEFCDTCVVYPFGPKKPFCKECAMTKEQANKESVVRVYDIQDLISRIPNFKGPEFDLNQALSNTSSGGSSSESRR